MRRALFCLVALGLFAGCSHNPQSLVDQLRKEIAAYKAKPDDKQKFQIDDDLAKLEGQVAEMEKRDDPRAAEFRSKMESLRQDYEASKMANMMQDTQKALQGLGKALKDGVNSVKDAFKDSTNK